MPTVTTIVNMETETMTSIRVNPGLFLRISFFIGDYFETISPDLEMMITWPYLVQVPGEGQSAFAAM